MELTLENSGEGYYKENRLTFGKDVAPPKKKSLVQRIREQTRRNKQCHKKLYKTLQQVNETVEDIKTINHHQNTNFSKIESKLENIIKNYLCPLQEGDSCCRCQSDTNMAKSHIQSLADEFLQELLDLFTNQENEYINQLELFKLEEEIKIEEKLAAYSSMTIKLEESMQMANSQSSIKNMITEMNSLQESMQGRVQNLKNLHSQRESIELQVIDELQDNNIPAIDLSKLLDTVSYDAKEIAFNTTQAVDMKTAIKEFKTHRSLEQSELEYITSSLSRYDKVREDIEIEIQQLQKKNLLLEQEVRNKDGIIEKLENANRILTNSTSNKLNCSWISAIPRTTRPRNKGALRVMASHIRRKNLSQAMSETKRSSFKTPEVANKHIDHTKEANTAEILKNPQLDIQSNNSLVENNGQIVDLSDILQTPDEDTSGFQNLLEDEILSNDLASLSNNEPDNIHSLNSGMDNSDQTPNFPNKIQSKLDALNENRFNEEAINLESKYLNMSLGNIPEEHEENVTLSDNNPSHLDKYASNNSNLSSRCISNSNSNAKEILRIKQERSKGSGDSRFSTYMTSDNMKQSFLNETTKFQEDSFIKMKILPERNDDSNSYKDSSNEKAVLSGFRPNLENNENSSLVSNSGNKDRINYKSNRGAIQPRRIFG